MNPAPGPPIWTYLVPIVGALIALIGVGWTLRATRKPAPRPYQLPPPPADFTGRAAELRALKRSAAAGRPAAILGIFGMGGVGKTALALKLAEKISRRYPDGQVYVDLQGVTTPMSPTGAKALVVRSFLPEAQVPENEAEVAALYRSVLHAKRVLLLLDNAASSGQVESLLPPRGCALLVTSRSKLVIPGLVPHDLDVLPEKDARALLLRISPRIGQAFTDLIRYSGGLPLALRLAGSTLAERPNLDPDEYARLLAEGTEGLGPVDAALAASYRLLEEELRRRWRLLGVFPRDFEARAVRSIWEQEKGETENALGKLLNSRLLDWDGVARYRLHDLARSFAKRQLDEAERETACGRHAAHYLVVLGEADALYQQLGEKSLRGLRLFDNEWSNIKAGQAWAAARPEADPEATALCDAYPRSGAYCLALRLPARDRIRWREAGLAAARRRQDRAAEATHLSHLGLDSMELGDSRRAIEFHGQQLAIASETGDFRGVGFARNSLGLIDAALGETGRAIELYEQNLAMAREHGDRWGEGTSLTNLGLAYADLGDTSRAIEYHEACLAMVREDRDRRREGNALNNLALAYAARGETRRSIALYEQRLAMARHDGDRRGEGNALTNLGLAYADIGKTRKSIALHKRRLAIAREVNDRVGEGNALGNLGLAYNARGRARLATEVLEQQLAIARERGDRWSEGSACWNLGLVFEGQGQFQRAAELMQVMVDLERETGHADAARDAAAVDEMRARGAAGGSTPTGLAGTSEAAER